MEIPEFWQLLIDSRLLPPQECQRLGEQFGYVKGAAAQGNAHTLAEWLIAENIISRYQATILLAGRPGPFAYGDYKIYDRLDEGPLKGQFKAVHAPTGHPVVLRFFAGQTVADPALWVQTARRAMQHASLSHPHLWRSFELVDLEQFKFLALEDIAGQSVARRLAASQRIPFSEACRIAFQIALALERMHEAGFVHGDVRPQNIVLDGQGRAILGCDLALPLAPDRSRGTDPELLARADYFAPELISPSKPPDALTDVYALGCTLYQMLSGEAPFAGGDFQHKMQRHAGEAIQPLAPFGVPEPLAKAVAYMMAKNAAVRYPRASVAADQLGAFLASSDRQPKVAPAPPTLSALEQHIRSKPKPALTPLSPSPVSIAPASAAARPGVGAASPAAAAIVAGGSLAATAGPASSLAAPVSLASERYKRNKPLTKNKPLLIVLGCGIAFLLTMGALYASGVFSSPGATVAQNDSENGEKGGGNLPTDTDAGGGEQASPPDDGAAGPRFQLVAQDDGQTLWYPPTLGEPVDLTFVPPQAAVYLAARPADILASSHGGDVLRSLGPDFARLRQNWEADAGVRLDEIERLVIGIHPNDSRMPRFSSTVFLKSPLDFISRWQNPTPAGGENLYSVNGLKAWVPAAAEGRVLVLGSPQEIDPLAAGGVDRPRPLLDPYFSHLLELSDGDQHLVALFDPHFFQTEGRAMFVGPYAKLVEPLDWFFGDDAKGMLSLHFGGDFYGELRLYARLQKSPAELQGEFRGKLDALPQKLEKHVVSLNPPDYWKSLWFKFPQMISAASRQCRIGSEDETAVINVSLPGHAAANLVAASELSISTAPGGGLGTGGPAPTATKTTPRTVEELLAAKVDFGFAQQSLEFSMRDLAAAVKDEYPDMKFDFQIKILGGDLQQEGITRNQQIRDVDARATPVGDILTQIVRIANPVTTVQSPSEIDQKLVWLLGPDPDDPSHKIVLITTRTAAGEKNLALPAVFQPR